MIQRNSTNTTLDNIWAKTGEGQTNSKGQLLHLQLHPLLVWVPSTEPHVVAVEMTPPDQRDTGIDCCPQQLQPPHTSTSVLEEVTQINGPLTLRTNQGRFRPEAEVGQQDATVDSDSLNLLSHLLLNCRDDGSQHPTSRTHTGLDSTGPLVSEHLESGFDVLKCPIWSRCFQVERANIHSRQYATGKS